MGKTANDEAYERGVKAGLKGGLLDDLVQSFSTTLNFGKRDEVYDKGYKWGAEHRHDPKYNSSRRPAPSVERTYSGSGSGSGGEGGGGGGGGGVGCGSLITVIVIMLLWFWILSYIAVIVWFAFLIIIFFVTVFVKERRSLRFLSFVILAASMYGGGYFWGHYDINFLIHHGPNSPQETRDIATFVACCIGIWVGPVMAFAPRPFYIVLDGVVCWTLFSCMGKWFLYSGIVKRSDIAAGAFLLLFIGTIVTMFALFLKGMSEDA